MRMLLLVLVACVLVAHAQIAEVPTNTSSALTRDAVENAGLTVLSTLLGIFLLFVMKESPLSPLAVPPLPHSPVGPYPPTNIRKARELHFMNNSFYKEIDHHDIKKRSLWRVGSGVSSVLNAAHLLALLSGIYLMIFVMEPVALPPHVSKNLYNNQLIDLQASNDIDVFSSRISANLHQNLPGKATNENYPSRPATKHIHRNSHSPIRVHKDSTLNLKNNNGRVIRPNGVVESLNPTGIGKTVNTTEIRL